MTIVAWDDLTHGAVIDWGIDPLVASFSGTQMVQDGSSVLGLLVIVGWLACWYVKAPRAPLPAGLTRPLRSTARSLLLGVVAEAAVAVVLDPPRPLNGEWPTGVGLLWWHATNALLEAVAAVAMTGHATLWQVRRLAGRTG